MRLLLFITAICYVNSYIVHLKKDSIHKRDLLQEINGRRYIDGVYWEDKLPRNNPPILEKKKLLITDGECKEIKNNNIEFTLCKIVENDVIKFNIDGEIKQPYMQMMELFIKNPSKTFSKIDKFMNDDEEVTIVLFILTTLMQLHQDPQYNLQGNIDFDKKINILLVFLTIMFKSPEKYI